MFKRARDLCSVIAVLLVLLLLPIAVLTEPAVQADPACVVTDSGDLADEINAISDQMPGSGSNGMVKPTGAQMIAWEAMLKDIVSGDLVAACNVIQNNDFPYDIVRYTDTGNSHESYLMLKENAPISLGWGTYVIKSDGLFRDVVIEIPHPRYELQTDEEGLEIFRQINARALLMAGTHRCANSTYSPCNGTTTVCGTWESYRESDVAHVTQAIFQVSHRVLVGCGSNTVAVQIHGHGRSNCPDLFISNTTCAPGELTNQLYLNAVIECNGTFSVDIADCTESECPLTGSTNVQGRYSNGCSTPDYDPCQTGPSGPSSPEQFIHLEQSRGLRQDCDCLIAALKATFPWTECRVYLPLVLSKARPEPVEGSEDRCCVSIRREHSAP